MQHCNLTRKESHFSREVFLSLFCILQFDVKIRKMEIERHSLCVLRFDEKIKKMKIERHFLFVAI